MKVSFVNILQLLLYICEDGMCWQLDRIRRMLIQTPRNRIPDTLKEKWTFSEYYALLYWEHYVEKRHSVFWVREKYNSANCGTVIIAQNYLLTAAHCVEDYKGNTRPFQGEARIYFGDFNQSLGLFDKTKYAKKFKTYEIEEIKIHRKYWLDGNANDIAVLKVKGSFPTKNQIRLCTPNDNINSYKLV